MTLAEIVARNLRAFRIAKQMPQHELARRARLVTSYVCMLELGRRTPPLETLEALAKALKVSPLQLLERNAAPASHVSRRGRRKSRARR